MTETGTLQVTMPSEREIAMTRVFDAPRRLVFDAYTKPELLKRWAGGPPGWNLVVCEVDLRVGGAWRWVIDGPDGQRMGWAASTWMSYRRNAWCPPRLTTNLGMRVRRRR